MRNLRNLRWPPTENFEYEATNPTRENGLMASLGNGGNPKRARKGTKGNKQGNKGFSK